MANRYWVGNGGDWDDTSHWSETSGGVGGASIPTSLDNAFFDANSFTITGQEVVEFSSSYSVYNLDFTGVTNNPVFDINLNIYGEDLILSPDITLESQFNFYTEGTINVTTNGCNPWESSWQIDNENTIFLLQDDLIFDEYCYLEVYAGTFDANDFDVRAFEFEAGDYNQMPTKVYMRSGTWTITDRFEIQDGYGGLLTFDKGTSTLRLLFTEESGSIDLYFYSYQDIALGDVVLDFSEYPSDWDASLTVEMSTGGEFNPGLGLNSFTAIREEDHASAIDIYFVEGFSYFFGALNISGYSIEDDQIISLASGFDQATFDVSTTTTITNCSIYGISVTGAGSPINVTSCYDLGQNTNLVFLLPPPHEISVSDAITIVDGIPLATNFLSFPATGSFGSPALGRVTSGNKAMSNRIDITETHLLEQVTVNYSGRVGSPIDFIILSVYEGGTNGDDGTLIATSSLRGPFYAVTQNSPTSFLLDTPVTLTSGNSYWFTFSRSGDLDNSNYYLIAYSTEFDPSNADSYKKNSSDVWSVLNSSLVLGIDLEYFPGGGLSFTITPPGEQIIPVDEIDFVAVSENVSLTRVDWVRNVSKLENVITVSESRNLVIPDYAHQLSVSDSLTVSDVIPERIKIRRAGPYGPDRYWVGGSGDWSDGNQHWSDSSGGDPGVDIPEGAAEFQNNYADNNVYFDENSFSVNGSFVNLDVPAYPKSIDMSGVDKTFSFTGSNEFISMGTVVILSPFLTVETTGDGDTWEFRSHNALEFDQAGADLSNVGVILSSPVDGSSNSTININSDIICGGDLRFKCYDSQSFFSSKDLDVTTNNYTLTTGGRFSVKGTIDTATAGSALVYAGTSIVNCAGFDTSHPSGISGVQGDESFFGLNATVNVTPTVDEGRFNVSGGAVGNNTELGDVNLFKGTGIIDFDNGGTTINGNLTVEPGTEIFIDTAGSPDRLDVLGTLSMIGTSDEPIVITTNGGVHEIFAAVVYIDYVNVENITAGGAAAPFYNYTGIDGGGNTNWIFPVRPDVHDDVYVFGTILRRHFLQGGILSQTDLQIVPGRSYNLTFEVYGLSSIGDPATVNVLQGTQNIYSFTTTADGEQEVTFTADSSGTSISFYPTQDVSTGIVDNVSLRERIQEPVDDNRPVGVFLEGTEDFGKPVIFRADTNSLELNKNFDLYSSPISIANRVQRGSQMKCFVSLDDGDFYELEGTSAKGVSLMKVHSNGRGQRRHPPKARKVKLSWRDSSTQLCRLVQSAIVFIPDNMDISE